MPVQALPKSTLLQNGGIDMKTKLLSMLTASIMLTAAVPMQPIQAADKAASNGIFGTLPEWVPQSFPDAMEFYNSHGKSYVSDNII